MSYISVYVPIDGQTGVTLNAVAIVMAGPKKEKKDGQNLTANPNDSPSRALSVGTNVVNIIGTRKMATPKGRHLDSFATGACDPDP